METVVKKRNANMELLRMISMLMVVMLHALGKSECLVNVTASPSVNGVIAWVLEMLSIAAVNIFVLISGYFLVDTKFRLRRLIELVLEAVFYGALGFLICVLFNIEIRKNVGVYFLLQTFLPIHMDVFWFVTAYIVLYMLQPVISAGVKALSQKQLGTVVILLIIYGSLFKSILPVRLETDELGYDLVWFLTVFLVGAYFKLYGFKHLTSQRKGMFAYLAAALIIFLEKMVLFAFYTKFGLFDTIIDSFVHYNNIFVLLEAVGLFAFFVNKKPMGEKAGKVICFMSPMALGVYLFHENICFRYQWPKWLGIYGSLSDPSWLFVLRIFAAVLLVYVCGSVIDYLRILLFKAVGRLFEKKNEA